jgi:hexosaminidase
MDRIRPAMLPDEALTTPADVRRVRHDAIGSTVLSMTQPDPRYNLRGAAGLVDGELLTEDWGCMWLAYIECDFEAVIDLGAVIPIRELGLVCMQQVFHGMYLPSEVGFEVSLDNRTYTAAGRATPDLPPEVEGPFTRALLTAAPEGTRGRFVRVRAANRRKIPEGLLGAGAKAWLMVDEILVNPAGLQQAACVASL